MIIGLYDADFARGAPPFNIDIMKLAAYFKGNKELTSLVRAPDAERFTNFYYRQDMEGECLTQVIMRDNVYFGGKFFSPKTYVPFIEEVENSKADFSIYEPHKDFYVRDRETLDIYLNYKRAQHIRLAPFGSINEKAVIKTLDLDNTQKEFIYTTII